MTELEYHKLRPDYSGMRVREMPFGSMENHHMEQEEYKLDFITKEGTVPDKLPAVFFIHGGGFKKPHDKRQVYISYFAKALTAAGYAVVSPDYPQFDSAQELEAAGGESAGYAKAAQAVNLAVEFMKSHSAELGIDPGRIAIIGGSAGGWAAFYAIAEKPENFRCFINCWGSPQQLPDVSAFPPTLSIHGTDDVLVPYPLETAAQAALDKQRIEHRLITLENCGHTPLYKMPEFVPEILKWLSRM